MRATAPYITSEDLLASLPSRWLDEAASDDSTIPGEMLTGICADASDKVDAPLSQRYPVPISQAEAMPLIVEAAKTFALWLCYQRRGKYGELNPWESAAEAWTKKLNLIGAGKENLFADTGGTAAAPVTPSISAVTGPMLSVPQCGGLAV